MRTVKEWNNAWLKRQEPILTEPIRAYLRRSDRTALLYDVVQDLIKAFKLTPEQAGRVIAQWVEETA